MKKAGFLLIIAIFALVALAKAQSPKDMYLTVKKAQMKASGNQIDNDNAIADARAEFDLFKDSKAAKKNPQFAAHIGAAINALREAQFESQFAGELNRPSHWTESMNRAAKELDQAKKCIRY
jgi:hypothetical protein